MRFNCLKATEPLKGDILLQGFPKNGKERGGSSPQWGKVRNFAGGIFLLGGGNLQRSDFDHSNLFQS